MTRWLGILLLLVTSVSSASPADFAGTWEVTKVVEYTGYTWSRQVKYPRKMTLELKKGVLSGRYTDQYGHSCAFPVAAVLNDGMDLLLANCGPTKERSAYAPVHHVKLVDGMTIHGLVMTNRHLFAWTAKRRK